MLLVCITSRHHLTCCPISIWSLLSPSSKGLCQFMVWLCFAMPAYSISDLSRPTSVKAGPKVDPPFEETWAALEKCVEEGLIRSIGVSNFSPEKIESSILPMAKIRPAVNQVCPHPNTQLLCLSQCIAALLQHYDGLVCCSCMLSNQPAVSSVLMIPCACHGFVACNAAAVLTVAKKSTACSACLDDG